MIEKNTTKDYQVQQTNTSSSIKRSIKNINKMTAKKYNPKIESYANRTDPLNLTLELALNLNLKLDLAL